MRSRRPSPEHQEAVARRLAQLSAELEATLPCDSLAVLRKTLVAKVPHLGDIDQVPQNDWQATARGALQDGALRYAVADFYLSNPIARASQLMAELSANAKARRERPMAAE